MRFYPITDFIGPPVLTAVFLLLLWLETRFALRRRVQARLQRLITNGAVASVAIVVIRLGIIPPLVWVARQAQQARFGLVPQLSLPPLPAAIVAFVLLDYAAYFWHWLNHKVPLLWRFHLVHHTDLDLDVSTAFRFHYGELLFSIVYQCALVAMIGAAPVAVLVYQVVMEAQTEFHHSNVRLPIRAERVLNWLIVTPRMHGIHHSLVERETNSNWSILFSWWDRLHRTVRLDVPQEAITIGVPAYREAQELTIFGLLLMPFRRQRPTWRLPDGSHPDRQETGNRDFLRAKKSEK